MNSNNQNKGPRSNIQNPNPNNRRPNPNGRNNNRRRFYRGNRPRNPENLDPAKAIERNLERTYEKYFNLLDQHLIARKKFHDLYYRADNQQIVKLERNFYQTLKDLRDYEERLTPDSKIYLEKRINGLKVDITYSTNHQISEIVVEQQITTASEVLDPHLLNSQMSANYIDDKEESVGSMDDYLRYKS
jgi:hypothetical protein